MKKIIHSFAAACILALLCPAFPIMADQQEICREGEHRFVVTLVHKAQEREPGLRLYTCEICNYSYTEEISPSGHEWSEWIIDRVPTEKEAGHRYRYCKKYSHVTHYQEEEIPPLLLSDGGGELLLLPEESDPADKEEQKEESRVQEEGAEQKDKRAEEAAFGGLDKIQESEISVEEEGPAQGSASALREQKEEETKQSEAEEKKEGMAFLFAGEPNGIDLASGIAVAGMAWWYSAVLAPMFAVLRWIEKKRALLREKNNLC
ncbi:MAG: hypothetical protein Q4A19_07030 [Johnsonella sp.]|nr:hypothetical protein [Johnsonella sp.]